ncbi:unnamed protein product [Citrullus colocynthis]|uniref:Uncharacterized protein n=1 Tax=Citrullus colocynthis TaxID=252529 RepID=A0ABP0Y498_9ROSI
MQQSRHKWTRDAFFSEIGEETKELLNRLWKQGIHRVMSSCNQNNPPIRGRPSKGRSSDGSGRESGEPKPQSRERLNRQGTCLRRHRGAQRPDIGTNSLAHYPGAWPHAHEIRPLGPRKACA